MASTTPRLPEQFEHPGPEDFHVNEVAADQAGAMSPYGPEPVFPMPLSDIRYKHPRPEDRPHLANGR